MIRYVDPSKTESVYFERGIGYIQIFSETDKINPKEWEAQYSQMLDEYPGVIKELKNWYKKAKHND